MGGDDCVARYPRCPALANAAALEAPRLHRQWRQTLPPRNRGACRLGRRDLPGDGRCTAAVSRRLAARARCTGDSGKNAGPREAHVPSSRHVFAQRRRPPMGCAALRGVFRPRPCAFPLRSSASRVHGRLGGSCSADGRGWRAPQHHGVSCGVYPAQRNISRHGVFHNPVTYPALQCRRTHTCGGETTPRSKAGRANHSPISQV